MVHKQRCSRPDSCACFRGNEVRGICMYLHARREQHPKSCGTPRLTFLVPAAARGYCSRGSLRASRSTVRFRDGHVYVRYGPSDGRTLAEATRRLLWMGSATMAIWLIFKEVGGPPHRCRVVVMIPASSRLSLEFRDILAELDSVAPF